MRPTTERLREALVQSHTLAIEVQVLENDEPVGEPLTSIGTSDTNSVLGGTVTLDAKAQTRGRVDLTLVDDGTLGLVPTTPADRLAPYGRELWVKRGVRHPDGSIELVSLGKFRIDDTNVDDSPGSLTITVAGMDRSARIIDATFEQPFEIAPDTNVADAILSVILPVYPSVETSFAVTDITTPKLLATEQSDRWKMCQDMATAAAMRLFFDGDGVLVLAPESAGAATVTIAEVPVGSSEPGVLLTASRGWTRQDSFNAVIATGENTGEAAATRGVARDLNPLSPTYFYGPFGQAIRHYQSQFIRTDAQAQDAAQVILDRELGTTETVRFSSLVLPYLEPGDSVRITRLRAGIDEEHVLDSVVIPLDAQGAMTGATRARVIQG